MLFFLFYLFIYYSSLLFLIFYFSFSHGPLGLMGHEVYTKESCLTPDNTLVNVNLVLRGLIKRKVTIFEKKKKTDILLFFIKGIVGEVD